MRRPFCFLFIVSFFLSTTLFSQPTDTINSERDSVRHVVEQTVKEYQDSLEREKLLQNIKEKGKPLDVFLAERKEEEKKEERRRWVRISAGAIFLFALFFAIARRHRTRNRR
jgi:hypothetical protein